MRETIHRDTLIPRQKIVKTITQPKQFHKGQGLKRTPGLEF